MAFDQERHVVDLFIGIDILDSLSRWLSQFAHRESIIVEWTLLGSLFLAIVALVVCQCRAVSKVESA